MNAPETVPSRAIPHRVVGSAMTSGSQNIPSPAAGPRKPRNADAAIFASLPTFEVPGRRHRVSALNAARWGPTSASAAGGSLFWM